MKPTLRAFAEQLCLIFMKSRDLGKKEKLKMGLEATLGQSVNFSFKVRLSQCR